MTEDCKIASRTAISFDPPISFQSHSFLDGGDRSPNTNAVTGYRPPKRLIANLAFPGAVIEYRFMKRLNWKIWAGFVLSLVAGLSYEFVFIRWPITRDFPWVSLILFAAAMVLLFLGLRRAFKPDKRIVSKIFSSLAAALGVLLLAGFLFAVFVFGRWLPASNGAPQVGQKAPEFTLTDPNNKPVTLQQLLTETVNNKPPKGVLLIFYRGYW